MTALRDPLTLRSVTLPNRVVFAAHLTNQAVDGLVTPAHVAYYAARAAGGVGLIVTEEHTVHPGDRPYEKLIAGYRPEVLDGYRRLTDAVHHHGAAVVAQLNHNGPQSSGRYTRRPVWGPSPVMDPLFREVPRMVDDDDLATLVAAFATVAARCREGGFDGVEVQASQSSILRSFLSPATNHRADRYGGPPEARARLLTEVAVAVRLAVGPDAVVGVRLGGEERVPGGAGVADAVVAARLVAGTGAVDYLSTTEGVATVSLDAVIPPMGTGTAATVPVAAALRRASGLPTVAAGRLADPREAARALQSGACDLVAVVRGQVAAPDLARVMTGDADHPVRRCLACNQECAARVGTNRWLGCVTNPRAGRETTIVHPPVRRRSVLVVGAGPAGLQAAAVAGARGHRVTLVDRDGQPGGRLRLAAVAPGRAGLGRLVADQWADCRRHGVEARWGEAATVASVVEHGSDAVIVATGARPRLLPWATGSPARVVDATAVLDGTVRPEGRVVVVDGIGGPDAPSVARLLAERGATVTVTTAAMTVGGDLGLTLDRRGWRRRAAALGIEQLTDLLPEAITGTGIRFVHHPTGRRRDLAADWVVTAEPPAADDELYLGLRRAGIDARRIGDCVAPRRVHAAVLEGQQAGEAL